MSSVAALITLTRPRFLAFLLLLPLFGYGWGHWDRALDLQNGSALVWVLVSWVFLHAGTMWLNALLDRDEGEVLLGRAVPPPPETRMAAALALIGCVPIAAMAGPLAAIAAAGCAVLSVLYSHPAVAWKGHPVGGPFVNVVGYGLLSPLAGWSAVGVPGNVRTLLAWALFAVGMLAPYFVAQAFQYEEDASRGYRTPVVLFGPRGVLRLARLALWFTLGGGVVLALIGWLPRVLVVACPLGWWIDRHLMAWSELSDGGDVSLAVQFARRVAVAAAVLIAACFAEYTRESFSGEPVAGLGTAAGHPPDRPCLAPMAMRVWEAQHGVVAPTDTRCYHAPRRPF